MELRGGHLRITEDVFIYSDEDADDDDFPKGRSRWWHWWVHKRVPRVRVTHLSYYSLIIVLLGMDVLAVAHCALSVATHGASVDILFGFEFAILTVSCLSSMGMYHLHVIDGVMGVIHHIADGEHHRVPVGGLAEADEGRGTTTTTSSNADGSGDPAVEVGGGRQPQDPPREGGDSDSFAASESAATAPVDRGFPHPPATTTRTKTLAKTLVERLANPWRDRRAMLSFAIELQAQAAKFMFYLVFFAIVFTYVSVAPRCCISSVLFITRTTLTMIYLRPGSQYGMPINIFREVYVSFQQLRRRLVAFNTYRRLTHNMDKRFESIKDEEELDRLGHTCIICRDSMDLLGGCKKLPGCGHAFHAHCLRDWLVQQQTCPTCRSDIAANEARDKTRAAVAAAAAAAAAEAVEESSEAASPAVVEGDELDAAPSVVLSPAPGDNANAVVAENDAASQRLSGDEQPQDHHEAVQRDQRPTSKSAPPNGDDTLPPGWTQHVHDGSGRKYYFNRGLDKTTWVKPANEKTALAETPKKTNDASSNGIMIGNNNFPCLYRIMRTTGAGVYDRQAVVQRVVPPGRLIVCTSIENWPEEAMLCMPDGYVRCRDVSFETSLFAPP